MSPFTRRKIAGALAFAALAALTTPATAVATQTNMVGTWSVDVHVPDVGVHQVTFHFAASGKACLSGEGVEGVGNWWPTGRKGFSYRVFEKMYDETGTHWGSIDVEQSGVRHHNTYRSSGVSDFFTPDGTPDGSLYTELYGTRTSAADPRCD
jgi:hypothetical protein